MNKEISVIVAVLNAAEKLEKCLDAIKNSTYSGFELVVVDDGSTDGSGETAHHYADIIIRHDRNLGVGSSWNSGVKASQGDILVIVDADVVVERDSLSRIRQYFVQHEEISAVTGRLSIKHPNDDFFSQYKNLYMNYIFGLLSEKVNFLYGSIHAVRRKDFIEYSSSRFAPDTEAGLEYVKRGKKIAFLKDLEVVHLKEYNLRSFIKNDFYTSSAWAKLFFGKRGFKQLFKHKSGFAHSPKKQLGSVILAPLIIVLLALSLFSQGQRYIGMVVLLCIGYGVLNADLFRFMYKKRGAAFLWKSMIVTFVDNSIMFLGILHGFILVLGRRGVYAKA